MPISFYDFVMTCFDNDELISNYNRLSGASIGVDVRSPIKKLIGKSTGHQVALDDQQDSQLTAFVDFAHDLWLRLPPGEKAGA